MTRGFAATALFLATLYGVPAAAQGAPGDADKAAQVQKLNDEGSSLYHARDYRRANEKFQQAYALDPDPNILYNIAKTYEHLGEDQAAIEKYEQFVADKGADPNGRAKAQEAIRMIRARLDAKKNPQAAQTQPGAGGSTAAAQPQAQGQTLVVPTVVALGIGVVGVGVGTAFGVIALGQKSDLDGQCTAKVCPPVQSGNISDLKSSSTISTVGFVVGGVGLAAAAILYIAGRPSSKEVAKGVRVTPLAGPTSVGLAGTF